MSKQSWIILVLLVVLNVTGYLYMQGGAPDIRDVRDNPALFRFADYKDKVELHTRLSTLFPRGTDKIMIEDFFHKAGITKGEITYDTCVYQIPFNNAAFIFDRNSDVLLAIQADEWPRFIAPACNKQAPLTPEAGETPIQLKMKELD